MTNEICCVYIKGGDPECEHQWSMPEIPYIGHVTAGRFCLLCQAKQYKRAKSHRLKLNAMLSTDETKEVRRRGTKRRWDGLAPEERDRRLAKLVAEGAAYAKTEENREKLRRYNRSELGRERSRNKDNGPGLLRYWKPLSQEERRQRLKPWLGRR